MKTFALTAASIRRSGRYCARTRCMFPSAPCLGKRSQRYSEDAEAFFLFRAFGQAAGFSGHLPDGDRNGRVFEREGSGGVPGSSGRGKIVGNPPLGRPGERLSNMRFIEQKSARRIPVEDDLEVAVTGSEEPGDEAICVSQF